MSGLAGPGKYDAECTDVRVRTNAAGVILLIFDGVKGPGFEVQATAEVLFTLPEILRELADSIEQGTRGTGGTG